MPWLVGMMFVEITFSELVSVQINPWIALKLIFKGYQPSPAETELPLIAWSCQATDFGPCVCLYFIQSILLTLTRGLLIPSSPWGSDVHAGETPGSHDTSWGWLQTRVSCHCHALVTLSWHWALAAGTLLTLALLCSTGLSGLIAAHGSALASALASAMSSTQPEPEAGLGWLSGVTHQEPLSWWHSHRHDTSSQIHDTTLRLDFYYKSSIWRLQIA